MTAPPRGYVGWAGASGVADLEMPHKLPLVGCFEIKSMVCGIGVQL